MWRCLPGAAHFPFDVAVDETTGPLASGRSESVARVGGTDIDGVVSLPPKLPPHEASSTQTNREWNHSPRRFY